uniref:LsmAD domain-containing protein n=1 Tax=Globodera pallida TaxID=36090 RepID=A0A183BY90_GLOPA
MIGYETYPVGYELSGYETWVRNDEAAEAAAAQSVILLHEKHVSIAVPSGTSCSDVRGRAIHDAFRKIGTVFPSDGNFKNACRISLPRTCQGPQPGVISEQLRDALGIGLRSHRTIGGQISHGGRADVGGWRPTEILATSRADDQCRIKPEKLIRFNYEANDNVDLTDDYVDFDAQQWLIPPWETFVQAQQHYIDQHLASIAAATDGTVEESGADDNGPVNKRSKTVADVGVERIEAWRRAKFLDESEAETDLDLRKLNTNKIDDNVTVRKSKKTTTKKLRKKRETLGEQQQQEPMVVLEMQLGTHVPLNRLGVEKPPLENWAIGIQAFQHQPPATSSGFFKRMHQIVKSDGGGGD